MSKRKVFAKLNLTLTITGKDESNYHTLDSLVTNISLYDTIEVIPRNDNVITLKETKLSANCPIEKNNAYIAAKKYMQKYNTVGADITIEKNIPVGAGLGGSSADICGVISCMEQTFGFNDNDEILRDCGSDTVYMSRGGLARIKGRGNYVNFLPKENKRYFILTVPDFLVASKQAYKLYDEFNKTAPCVANSDLRSDNDLFKPVSQKYPLLLEIRAALYDCGAEKADMTGSGSCMYAQFSTEKSRDEASKRLKLLKSVKIYCVDEI